MAAVDSGVAEIDPRRLVLCTAAIVFTGLGMLAQTAWVSNVSISVNSWALVLATTCPSSCASSIAVAVPTSSRRSATSSASVSASRRCAP